MFSLRTHCVEVHNNAYSQQIVAPKLYLDSASKAIYTVYFSTVTMTGISALITND